MSEKIDSVYQVLVRLLKGLPTGIRTLISIWLIGVMTYEFAAPETRDAIRQIFLGADTIMLLLVFGCCSFWYSEQRSWIERLQKEHKKSMASVEEMLEACEKQSALAIRAGIHLARGDSQKALELWEEAYSVRNSTDD